MSFIRYQTVGRFIETSGCAYRGAELRRLLAQGAVKVNGTPYVNFDTVLQTESGKRYTITFGRTESFVVNIL